MEITTCDWAMSLRHAHRHGLASRPAGGKQLLRIRADTRLNLSLPGVERQAAQALVEEADQTCPYSKATRGNIDVAINLV
jgi:organic hydroperoxide reductase OsmC/OhrA